MNKKHQFVATCLATLLCSSASATVLTFDLASTTGDIGLPLGYGDRVTATTMGDFLYGAAGGFTPNVEVQYAPTLTRWSTGYNELINVIENEADGDNGYSVTFTADAGFNVLLSSLNMGNWGAAISVPGMTVTDGNGNILFSESNIALDVSTSPTSRFFNFGNNVVANQLIIQIDTTGLGGNSDNVGLDNIQFSQVVPVPAAVWLFGSGLLGLVGVSRRRT